MRVLVTGGAGFIGSFVVDALAERGHEVVVLDNLHPGAHSEKPSYLNDAATYRWADTRDPQAVEHAAAGIQAVCHQASMVGLGVDFADAPDYVSHNDLGTAVLLRALAATEFAGRIVLASSMVVYGEGAYDCASCGPARPGPRRREDLEAGAFEPRCPRCDSPLQPRTVTEDAPTDPRNVYAATKLHQEHLCAAFGRERLVPVTSLRYHNVYGPRMPRDTPYAGVASIFRSSLEGGRAPRVFEDGSQRRDFVHVRDVATANVLALTAERAYDGPLNVASGAPHTVLEMATELSRAMDGPAPQVTGDYRLGDVRHVFASAERAEETIGFRAAVSFAEGMTEFARAPLRSPAR